MPSSAGTAVSKVSAHPALSASTALISSLHGRAVCLFFLLLLSFLLVIASLPGLLLTQLWWRGEQFLRIHGQITKSGKLLKCRPTLCFGKQNISYLGLKTPLN